MEVAQTILHQIKVQDKWALPGWGANQFVAIESGVQFKIRTPQYPRGVKVLIKLNSLDEYDVEAWRVHGTVVKKLNEITGIHWDQLIECIDELIEGDKKNVILV
jgi:hypothetical protein